MEEVDLLLTHIAHYTLQVVIDAEQDEMITSDLSRNRTPSHRTFQLM